jgi:hypothetical protein
MDTGQVALTLGFVALAIEVIIANIRHLLDVTDRAPKILYGLLAIGLGLVSAFAFGINAFAHDGPVTHLGDVWGRTLTGLVAAGGSHVVHVFLSRVSPGAPTTKGVKPRPKG